MRSEKEGLLDSPRRKAEGRCKVATIGLWFLETGGIDSVGQCLFPELLFSAPRVGGRGGKGSVCCTLAAIDCCMYYYPRVSPRACCCVLRRCRQMSTVHERRSSVISRCHCAFLSLLDENLSEIISFWRYGPRKLRLVSLLGIDRREKKGGGGDAPYRPIQTKRALSRTDVCRCFPIFMLSSPCPSPDHKKKRCVGVRACERARVWAAGPRLAGMVS